MNRLDDAVRDLLADVPPAPTVDGLRSRIRRSRRRRAVAIVVVAGVISIVTVGVVASFGHKTSGPRIAVRPDAGTASTTTVADSSSGAALTFRPVLGVIPYGSSTATSVAAGARAPESCEGGRLVTTADQPGNNAILADRQKTSCYLLGPTILTETNVRSADAAFDRIANAWDVNVQFANDDFVKDVASVYVNRQIALILDGVVESAPTVNPGITGSDITISGSFDESTARAIATRLDPSSAAIPGGQVP